MKTEPGDSQAVTLKERFLAHMYNAITIAQHLMNKLCQIKL